MTYRIGVIRGDGTGPEVVAEALKVLEAVRDGFDVETVEFDLGADRYLRTGEVLPADELEGLRGCLGLGVRLGRRLGLRLGVRLGLHRLDRGGLAVGPGRAPRTRCRGLRLGGRSSGRRRRRGLHGRRRRHRDRVCRGLRRGGLRQGGDNLRVRLRLGPQQHRGELGGRERQRGGQMDDDVFFGVVRHGQLPQFE